MGGVRFTVQNLSVQSVDPDTNIILVRGALPGPKGGLVLLRTAAKAPVKKGGVAK
jgi:large subunit ribosomal protein L3